MYIYLYNNGFLDLRYNCCMIHLYVHMSHCSLEDRDQNTFFHNIRLCMLKSTIIILMQHNSRFKLHFTNVYLFLTVETSRPKISILTSTKTRSIYMITWSIVHTIVTATFTATYSKLPGSTFWFLKKYINNNEYPYSLEPTM